ncbi:MAG: type I glyceraldehyde-3-phosphate dehydrogenase [Thermovirgaceae bacterium]
MKKARVAINGFGRIGRLALRALHEYDSEGLFEIVATNSRTDADQRAYLFKYDSVHRRFPKTVESKNDAIVIEGREVKVLQVADIRDLPWKDLDIDIVIESSGRYTDAEKARAHLDAGAKKVLITAPAKGEDATIVMGVNEAVYDAKAHHIVSNASCTTNCLAPVVKVLHEQFGIVKGLMTTAHSYTNDQKTLDASHKKLHRGRAAALSIIPTTTGAAAAIGKVIPDIQGKLNGIAMRVPTPDVSVVDLTLELEKAVDAETINETVREYSLGELRGILAYETEDLVSMDFVGDSHSSIFAGNHTMVIDNMAKTLAWYDNEWGYACRVLDLVNYMIKKGL